MARSASQLLTPQRAGLTASIVDLPPAKPMPARVPLPGPGDVSGTFAVLPPPRCQRTGSRIGPPTSASEPVRLRVDGTFRAAAHRRGLRRGEQGKSSTAASRKAPDRGPARASSSAPWSRGPSCEKQAGSGGHPRPFHPPDTARLRRGRGAERHQPAGRAVGRPVHQRRRHHRARRPAPAATLASSGRERERTTSWSHLDVGVQLSRSFPMSTSGPTEGTSAIRTAPECPEWPTSAKQVRCGGPPTSRTRTSNHRQIVSGASVRRRVWDLDPTMDSSLSTSCTGLSRAANGWPSRRGRTRMSPDAGRQRSHLTPTPATRATFIRGRRAVRAGKTLHHHRSLVRFSGGAPAGRRSPSSHPRRETVHVERGNPSLTGPVKSSGDRAARAGGAVEGVEAGRPLLLLNFHRPDPGPGAAACWRALCLGSRAWSCGCRAYRGPHPRRSMEGCGRRRLRSPDQAEYPDPPTMAGWESLAGHAWPPGTTPSVTRAIKELLRASAISEVRATDAHLKATNTLF